MADTSAEIGANFSDYRGDPNLGGGGFGVVGIDTKPLENLASYTMLYNQTVWKQNQKETDDKVAQLADLSKIALNDLKGKDKDLVAKDFTQLQSDAAEYAAKVPKNSQERLQNELKWQTRLGSFYNNYNSGKGRSIAYYAHLNTIKQNVTDATTQDEAIKQLDKTFNDTDISTPISAVPNFKMEKFEIPDPTTQKINTVAILGNDNIDVEGSIFNPKQNVGKADAAILDLQHDNVKKGTPEYNALSQNEKNQADLQATVSSSGKGWVDAVDPLNTVLKNYIKPDGTFDATRFEDENSANTTVMNAYNAAKNLNTDSHTRYTEATNGVFNDKGVQVKLPEGVAPDDFKAGFIDFTKGVTPTQLVLSGMYAKHTGDVFNKKVTHTGDQRAADLEKMRELNALKLKNIDESGANYRAGLDLIGKGYTRDAKGKWIPPVKNATTAAGNNGLVPYWQNYIAPQIDAASMKTTTKEGGILGFFQSTKENPIPKNYTGDVDVPSDKISGLSVALSGETASDGKAISYDSKKVTKVRFNNGKPIGVVIDDVFYDQNDINSKATRLQDKNVNNKFDSAVFGQTENPAPIQTVAPSTQSPTTTTSKGLPIFK